MPSFARPAWCWRGRPRISRGARAWSAWRIRTVTTSTFCNGSRNRMSTQRSCDVVVVGGGLSGLYAARLLTAAGVDVLVLEAQSRVGGRTLTGHFGDGTFVDDGGQWVSPGQDCIVGLAEELGVGLFPSWSEGVIARTRGVDQDPALNWLSWHMRECVEPLFQGTARISATDRHLGHERMCKTVCHHVLRPLTFAEAVLAPQYASGTLGIDPCCRPRLDL